MLDAMQASRPQFLDGDISDQELQIECRALAEGRYAGWHVERMQDHASHEEPLVMREIWLANRQHGGTEIVRLQRQEEQDAVVWHPVSSHLWLSGVF